MSPRATAPAAGAIFRPIFRPIFPLRPAFSAGAPMRPWRASACNQDILVGRRSGLLDLAIGLLLTLGVKAWPIMVELLVGQRLLQIFGVEPTIDIDILLDQPIGLRALGLVLVAGNDVVID